MDIDLAPAAVTVERLADGSLLLRSPTKLEAYERSLGELLRRSAARFPEKTFLAERAAGNWRTLNYAQALAGARAVAQSLLDRNAGKDRPVLILSGNSIDHALLTLGGLLAGVPVAPVSPAYSLKTRDYALVRQIFELVRPGLVFAQPAAAYAGALAALDLTGVEVVVNGEAPAGRAVTPFAQLLKTRPTESLDQAERQIGPDTVAKYLFTSGSTGAPKGVINTHGMLCANQQMLAQCMPFLAGNPPVLVDWLPWNHTFGGCHNFNLVLKHGGTLYIDAGKPLPGLFEQTIENLRDVSPTIYFNVPAGFAQLVPRLEQDSSLRDKFFHRLQMIYFAGAALPADLWERVQALARQARGRPVFMASGWGSTETAPLSTSLHFPTDSAAVIGLPPPGVEIKMVPSGGKMELRVRGPHVTPGYLKRPDLTAAAFDDSGFYKIGDAGRFADPSEPVKGLVFDGRTAEDFKLTSGTWVHVGLLRTQALSAASPALQDAAITGHDRDCVGLLAWPNLEGCKKLCGHAEAAGDPARLVRSQSVIDHVRAALQRHNRDAGGSSARIGRILLMADPPDVDAGEITDKGYINQRAVLEHRRHLVERLYQDPPAPDVIVLDD